jgi:uncharacterized protein YbaA (DUF1428 family)
MTYIDGFVATVPVENKDTYLEHARITSPVFKKYGALRVVYNWGDEVPDGEVTSFPLAVKAKPGEVIVFSWIEWPSKEAREKGMEQCMADPIFNSDMEMPFDGKRMLIGSFETISDE